jgi:hypothetical protein
MRSLLSVTKLIAGMPSAFGSMPWTVIVAVAVPRFVMSIRMVMMSMPVLFVATAAPLAV